LNLKWNPRHNESMPICDFWREPRFLIDHGDSVWNVDHSITHTSSQRARFKRKLLNCVMNRSVEASTPGRSTAENIPHCSEARDLLAKLFISFDRRAQLYHWQVNGSDETVSSLLDLSNTQYIQIMSFCGFYQQETDCFLQTVFDGFLAEYKLKSLTFYRSRGKKKLYYTDVIAARNERSPSSSTRDRLRRLGELLPSRTSEWRQDLITDLTRMV